MKGMPHLAAMAWPCCWVTRLHNKLAGAANSSAVGGQVNLRWLDICFVCNQNHGDCVCAKGFKQRFANALDLHGALS